MTNETAIALLLFLIAVRLRVPSAPLIALGIAMTLSPILKHLGVL